MIVFSPRHRIFTFQKEINFAELSECRTETLSNTNWKFHTGVLNKLHVNLQVSKAIFKKVKYEKGTRCVEFWVHIYASICVYMRWVCVCVWVHIYASIGVYMRWVCVCVCVCARASAGARVCLCVRLGWKYNKETFLLATLLQKNFLSCFRVRSLLNTDCTKRSSKHISRVITSMRLIQKMVREYRRDPLHSTCQVQS